MSIEIIKKLDIPVVESIQPFTTLEKLIEYTRSLKGAEGFIVAFDNGHKVKIKADEYVRIHKTIDRITFDRNIVDLIVNENVDDAIPMLPQEQVDRIRDFETRFWAAFKQKENRLMGQRMSAFQTYQDNRKRIALEMVPHLRDKSDSGFIFKMLDGHNIRDLLLDHIRKNINTNVKWDECAKWMGM